MNFYSVKARLDIGAFDDTIIREATQLLRSPEVTPLQKNALVTSLAMAALRSNRAISIDLENVQNELNGRIRELRDENTRVQNQLNAANRIAEAGQLRIQAAENENALNKAALELANKKIKVLEDEKDKAAIIAKFDACIASASEQKSFHFRNKWVPLVTIILIPIALKEENKEFEYAKKVTKYTDAKDLFLRQIAVPGWGPKDSLESVKKRFDLPANF